MLWSISADRILSTSGGVAFFALLAILPAVTAIVSLYGLFADASTIGKHLTLLAGILPGGVLDPDCGSDRPPGPTAERDTGSGLRSSANRRPGKRELWSGGPV